MRQPFPFGEPYDPFTGAPPLTADEVFDELRRQDVDAQTILARCKMTWLAVAVAFLWGCATGGAPSGPGGPRQHAPEVAMFLPENDVTQSQGSALKDCEEACTLAMRLGFAGDPNCAEVLLQASFNGVLRTRKGQKVTCRDLINEAKSRQGVQ